MNPLNKVKTLWRQNFKRPLFIYLAFGIPFLLVLLAFALQRVHPFGNKMILTVDLYHQYAPFLAEMRHKILNGQNLFFSWNIGLGTNFWAILANYTASPLNLLLLPVPQRFLADGIAFLVCLRAGLSGLFFALLLRDMDQKREDVFLSLFGSLYALSGWGLAYFWNIMWGDAVTLLPLIILGLRYLMRDNKPKIFAISLFLCIWSNFYAAFFICLFLVIYAPLSYFSLFDRFHPKHFFKIAGKFALYSGLAALATSALVYPTWVALQHSSATGDSFPKDIGLTHTIFDFISRFFLASKPNIRDGMANVYSGVIILILVPLFFFNTKIRLKHKIVYGSLMVIMYFSFANRLLNFIWHGFHFPNQIPYRQAFIMSFVVLIIAYQVLRNFRSVKLWELTLTSSLVLAYVILYEQVGKGQEASLAIFLTLAFIIFYVIITRYIVLKPRNFKFQQFALMVVLIVELVVASQVTIGLVAKNEGFTGWEFFGKKSREVTKFITQEEKSGENNFIRAEMYPAFISNQTALYHVKGMSVFSSTANERFVKFMKTMGFHNNGINGTRNHGMNKVTSSLFGINYLIDVNGTAALPTGFEPVVHDFDLTIQKNPDALPIGYAVDSQVLDFQTTQKSNPFLTSNDFIKALGASEVYYPQYAELADMSNLNLNIDHKEQGSFELSPVTKDETASLTININNAQEQSHIFMYVESKDNPGVKIENLTPGTIENPEEENSPKVTSYDLRTDQIADLGIFEGNQTKKINLNWKKISSDKVKILLYYVDQTGYQNMLSKLNQAPLTVQSYKGNSLEGTIHTDSHGLMLLTVPFDNGWSATVDDKKVEIESIGDALMGVSLTPGNHEIKMQFVPEGFYTGLFLSVVGSVVFIFIMLAHPFISKKFPETTVLASEFALGTGDLEREERERMLLHMANQQLQPAQVLVGDQLAQGEREELSSPSPYRSNKVLPTAQTQAAAQNQVVAKLSVEKEAKIEKNLSGQKTLHHPEPSWEPTSEVNPGKTDPPKDAKGKKTVFASSNKRAGTPPPKATAKVVSSSKSKPKSSGESILQENQKKSLTLGLGNLWKKATNKSVLPVSTLDPLSKNKTEIEEAEEFNTKIEEGSLTLNHYVIKPSDEVQELISYLSKLDLSQSGEELPEIETSKILDPDILDLLNQTNGEHRKG